VLANELDQAVAVVALGVSLGIGLEVAKVANMAFLVAWGTVGLAMGVVWSEMCQLDVFQVFSYHDIQ